ncbi:MAG: FMN-binding protein [bacterium]|nr:FMN-binding protein [bacterium]
MTENDTMNEAPKAKSPIIPAVIIIALITVLTVGVAAFQNSNEAASTVEDSNTTASTAPAARMVDPAASPISDTGVMESVSGEYRDGTYEVEGNYTSPGGPESIKVELTLQDGIVIDSAVVSLAERPQSVNFQGIFVENYKEFVVGKSIDEIELTTVSGSSLTPKGFNDAVERIKAQAQVS